MSKKKEGKYKKIDDGNKAKKKYGQNFLEDKVLLEEIMELANITKKTEVFEIGPGRGFLTGRLIEKSKFLTAFEIDDDLIPYLEQKFGKNENFNLVHRDFMEVDLEEYVKDRRDIKVVANIPYYITSPIINKLIGVRECISEIYLMVQKEVAERITSKVKSSNMSLLTHAVQFYGKAEYLFTVPKEKFSPVPKVDSAFIRISLFKDRKYEGQISEEEYFKYLKVAFSNKRKSTANNLSQMGLDKRDIGEILMEMGKSELARTEEFSVQEFINMISLFKEIKK